MNDAALAPPERRVFPSGDVTLVADCWGDPDAHPVLLLHGGGQTRHAWAGTARALAANGFRAVALDLRGHGEGGWALSGLYPAEDFFGDVERVAASFERPPIVVGASLGGMIALTVEGLTRPGSTAALVLVDVAHDAKPEGAARIVGFMKATSAGFDSLAAAADVVAAYLPDRPRPKTLDGLRKNLAEREDGRWYWRWDPRLVENFDIDDLRARGRFADAARALRVPLLLVRGGESDVVDARIAEELLALVPDGRAIVVAGARHMVAGDANDAFAEAILPFCRAIRDRGSLGSPPPAP